MKALVLTKPGEAIIDEVAEPANYGNNLLLKVRMVGLCGSDLDSFRGKNSMVAFPRVLGHEVAAKIMVDLS